MNKTILKTSATGFAYFITLSVSPSSSISDEFRLMDLPALSNSNTRTTNGDTFMGIKNIFLDQSYALSPQDDFINNPIFEKYGTDFKKRLIEFKNCSHGWNMGSGEPLSDKSLSMLKTYLEIAPTSDERPGVFLTKEGNISLAWRDKENGIIEFEFEGDVVKYNIEKTDEEGVVEADGIHFLNNILSQA